MVNMVNFAEGKPSQSREKKKNDSSFKGKTINSANKARKSAGWVYVKPRHQKKNFCVFKNKQKKEKGGQAFTSKDLPNKADHAISE